jgi:hypothetical protein
MEHLKRYVLPRTPTGQAALVAGLYTFLALFVLYAPIEEHALFVRMFGSRAQAREVMSSFVQFLFWPLVVLLLMSAGRECVKRFLAAQKHR